MSDNIETVLRYLKAIENGAPFDEVRAFYTDDAVQEEFPNRLVPNGARRGLAELGEAAERGRKVMTRQRYDVVSVFASGDRVVAEVLWTGTLSVPFGTIAAGGDMTAHFAVLFDMRDGRIAAQRNYDCFDPF